MEQRKQDRFNVSDNPPLSVRVSSDGRCKYGNIVDVTGFGLATTIRVDSQDAFEVGMRVDLQIQIGANHPPLTAAGHVRSCSTLDGELERYGIEFVHNETISIEDGSATLRTIFNRRISPRVNLNTDDQPSVACSNPKFETCAEGHLQNISCVGASVLIPIMDGLAFDDSETMHLEFCLPGSSAMLLFDAVIRHRYPVDASMMFAVEFEGTQNGIYDFKRDVLLDFVSMSLQKSSDEDAA